MLSIYSTKFGAGVKLFGDYRDLQSLHQTIHFLCSEERMDHSAHEFVVGLAYDVRKAYEGSRLVEKFGFDALDQVTYRGVEILWPILIPQMSLLRRSAAYAATTRNHQADLYALEAGIEGALLSSEAVAGRECLQWLDRGFWFTKDYLIEFIYQKARQFACEIPPGKKRLRALPDILRQLHPLSPEYKAFAEEVGKIAKDKGCSPAELQDWNDWPEFKW